MIEAPTAWRTVQLGEVLKRVERFETKDETLTYPFAGIYSFGRGVFVGEAKAGTSFKLGKVQRIREGDFVYSKIMAWEGAFGIVPPEADNHVMSGAFIAYSIDERKLDPAFLGYYFSLERVWKEVGKQSTGTNVRRRSLHPKQFEKATMPLPPLPEQRRIVAKIQQLVEKVEEARGLRERSVIGLEALLTSATQDIFKEFQAHATTPLSKVVSVLGGGTPSKRNALFWGGSIPWITPKDMKVAELFDSQDHITQVAIKDNAATLIPKNCVLLVARSGILRRTLPVAINRVRGTINQDLKALIPRSDLLPEFLYWWFRGNEPVILEECVKGGTTVQSLIWKKITELEIFIPPVDEQKRIIAHLEEFQAKADSLENLQKETQRELDALLPSILDKAFKGEL